MTSNSQPGGAEKAELRSRIEDLETELERLQRELSETRAKQTHDGVSWMLGEASDSDEGFSYSLEEVPGLFSVVVPAYNAAGFLRRCVESVCSQEIPRERLEILIVDDGSEDDTLTIANDLAAESAVSMRVLSHPGNKNRGVAASRNLACRHARGEFIALLDADDAFLPARIAAADTYFTENPEAHCLCSLGQNVDGDGNPVKGHNGTEIAGEWRGIGEGIEPPFTFEMLWQADPVANSSLTIRRSAFGTVGGFPDVMAHQAEDWLLVLKLSHLAPIPCLEEPLFLYSHHPDAYTHQYHAGNLRDGARLELFFHLAHWLLNRKESAELGREFFRREYPKVLAGVHRVFPAIRDYALRRGTAFPTWKSFEEYLNNSMGELESLRRVVRARILESKKWRQEALALREALAKQKDDA